MSLIAHGITQLHVCDCRKQTPLCVNSINKRKYYFFNYQLANIFRSPEAVNECLWRGFFLGGGICRVSCSDTLVGTIIPALFCKGQCRMCVCLIGCDLDGQGSIPHEKASVCSFVGWFSPSLSLQRALKAASKMYSTILFSFSAFSSWK